MKPLAITLIFAVIVTTIGAGWVITQLHTRLSNNGAETDQNLIAYKQLGKAIGLTLDGFSYRDEFVLFWKEKSDIDIIFQNRTEFLVPGGIVEEFKSGTPLLLESEGEMSLHFYMQSADQVMSILLPIKIDNQQYLLNIILTLLFYLVIIAVLLVWLIPLIQRLIMLQDAAIKLGTGDLSSRVSLSKFSYIRSIEKEFNRMAHQIQNLVDDNQLLSRAVSHNLKTPITRLRMGIDVLEEAKDKSEIDKYIKRINSDLDEMQSLVETLLQYSSLDEFKFHLKNEPIDLCQLIPRLIDYENRVGIKIETDFSNDSVVIYSDSKYLSMSLVNVLSNAIQHAKSIVNISVELKNHDTEKSVVSISVEDDGNGISEADYDNVIKPFWRGHNNPAIKGHGMGLAIVARIGEWLHADLVITRSVSLGGTSVSIAFESQ